jgi:hypothetical protein
MLKKNLNMAIIIVSLISASYLLFSPDKITPQEGSEQIQKEVNEVESVTEDEVTNNESKEDQVNRSEINEVDTKLDNTNENEIETTLSDTSKESTNASTEESMTGDSESNASLTKVVAVHAGDLVPPKYQINMRFNPQERILSGTSHITVWNRAEKSTDYVLIQAFMNAFQEDEALPVLSKSREKAYPRGIKYSNMTFQNVKGNGKKVEVQLNGSVLRLELERPWLPGQKLEVSLEWETVIPDVHHRVGAHDDAFWFGNVLPVMAVYDGKWHGYQYETIGDPFFSEASQYAVTIQLPENYEVITSGKNIELDIKNGQKTIKVEADRVREFAFAITSNHKVVSAVTKSGKVVHLYYRYTSKDIITRNLSLAVDMLDYLEKRVGEYPYEQLYIFENNMFITGMEYPGLVFVSEHRFKTDTGHVTLLHEIAHQWFYNVIGNDQVLEPWLDEGFATYFTDEFLQGEHLENHYRDERKWLDQRAKGLRIQSVHHYNDWSTYWRSNYRKSSLLIFDLRQRMGEEKFQNFIKEYYRQFQFEIATTEEFKKLLQNYLKEDIESIFKEWGLTSIH